MQANNASCFTLSFSPGPYKISHWLPLLSSDFPIPHQDVASKHLWGENACVCVCLMHVYWTIKQIKMYISNHMVTMLQLLLNIHLSTPEWRCLYFHPPSSCGWPPERRAALGAMEPHTECQVLEWKYPQLHSNHPEWLWLYIYTTVQ